MTSEEFEDIAKSYGLVVLVEYSKRYNYIIDVYFEDYPDFWDKDYFDPNKFARVFCGEITVYTSLEKDKTSGKYVKNEKKILSIGRLYSKYLNHLIKRISKSIKNEQANLKLAKIEKDF